MVRYFFDLWRDVVYAVRMLLHAPGFTAVGILSLTLGIGVCSVFYSEINSMVLRPLPVARHPEALVALMNSVIQLSSTFYGGIGVFGLILASIGLAGITAYAVARRTKEIGIRVALGASRNQVLGLVMKEGAALVAAGTVVGLAGAVVISRALSSMTAEVARAIGSSTGDPVLLIGAPLLLAALAMLACYLPARKATEIDPLTALRQE